MALDTKTFLRLVRLESKRDSGKKLSKADRAFLKKYKSKKPRKKKDPNEDWGKEIDLHPIGRGPGPRGAIATD